jgi:phosphate transport system substrate-binding protein
MRTAWMLIVPALAAGFAGAQSPAAVEDPIALQRARAVWLKQRGEKAYYTRKFDLSGLPAYTASAPMTGTIRQAGSNYLADSPLAGYLEDGFRRHHPGVRFENNLMSTFIGVASLYMDRADIAAMGRRPTWDELQAYQRVFNALPVEIAMASGSLDVPGWTFALVVLVHKDNPLEKLTLEQVDGIFGAQRDGGWDGNTWNPAAARGPEKNIRTWGQLGLAGEWAARPINVYGYNLNYHFPRDFAENVFHGGYKWNETMREFSNKARPDGQGLISAGVQMVEALGNDRYGITYGSVAFLTPRVKALPLAAKPGGPFVAPTLETVQDKSYPLSREVYYLANRAPGKTIGPLFREYLRFVVSRDGQELVMKDGKYLPLTAEMSREQLRKLDAVGQASQSLQ